MKIEVEGKRLRVSEVEELGMANARAFREEVLAALDGAEKELEIDLSQTTFVDSCGLGALVALRKVAEASHGTVCLVNPQPPVRQILELARMHRVFKITQT